ncbi:HK97 gp10 family phage protein [Lysinibacillus sp. KU-BSD001]|uniref:HK97 gp10 family phage protein n=1 Tax=Lysinibacillus sp. KU-BSD001 TaxID=3141328 RepID=UPI0036E6FBC1
MVRWGRVDFRQLQRMQRKMERLERAGFDKFCEDAAKELAARLLAKVIKRTPVKEGTLRNAWTAGKKHWTEDGKGNVRTNRIGGASGFANGLEVTQKGDVYEITVSNSMDYASYVEYGHRTRDHKGWVNGRFMMTISADEVERAAPAILEKKLMRLLREAFDGN